MSGKKMASKVFSKNHKDKIVNSFQIYEVKLNEYFASGMKYMCYTTVFNRTEQIWYRGAYGY